MLDGWKRIDSEDPEQCGLGGRSLHGGSAVVGAGLGLRGGSAVGWPRFG